MTKVTKVLMHHRIASKDGQYVHLMEILKAMQDSGIEVKLVGPSMFDEAEFGHDGGFTKKLKNLLPMPVYELLEMGYSLIVAIRLWRAVKEFKPDFIYERYNLYQPAGVIVAKLLKLPLYLEVNAPLVLERKEHSDFCMERLASFCERFTWRNASAVLPVTKVLAEKYILPAGVASEKVMVIHNGVRAQKLVENQGLVPPLKKDGEITLGFAGFAHLTCGIEYVLTFMAKLADPRVKLVCVGPTEEGAMDYQHQVEALGLQGQVSFVGLKTPEEAQALISGFDVALLPAVTEYASPLKIFDYMAAKCLVVAPDRDNIKEILTHCDVGASGNAILFKEDSTGAGLHAALSHAVTLCSDGGAAAVAQAAFDTISKERFTWEDNVERIVNDLYRAGVK